MNAKSLLLGTVLITLATSAFATDALLTPRAAGNQIKVTPGLAQVTVAAPATGIYLSPRAATAQSAVATNVGAERNPALDCIRSMQGTPRAVTACSQSVTMPGCQKLALK